MSADTLIEWADSTWNPVRGCSRISPGCQNCYAERQAVRLAGPGRPYEGLVRSTTGGPRWTGKVVLDEEALREPLRWRVPRRVFVNSMSDLFHEDLPDDAIWRVFQAMAGSKKHTFQVLTKRAVRMQALLSQPRECPEGWVTHNGHSPSSYGGDGIIVGSYEEGEPFWKADRRPGRAVWPLPNIWLGVSCEDQARADERIPLLLQTPAAVRFVSAEPLLGPIDFLHGQKDRRNFSGVDWLHDDPNTTLTGRRLDWVIAGGESGPGARPCDLAWIRSIVAQCKAAGVACFVKQLGAAPAVSGNEAESGHPTFKALEFGLRDRKGGDPEEWPEDLRVREFPR